MKTLQRYIPKDYIEYKPRIGDYPKDLFSCYVSRDDAKPIAIFYKGKAGTPLFHNRFYSLESMKEKINKTISNLMAYEDRKLERREERKNATKGVEVGQLYSYSWGYDQTNVDFFQVTEIKGKTFTIREIAQKQVSNDCGNSMSADVAPIKDAFLENSKPILKRSLSMPHGILSLTNENQKHYSSWYA